MHACMHECRCLTQPQVHGTHYDGLVHVADWYATFAALAGLDTNNTGPAPVDGVNLWPALSAMPNTPEPHSDLLIMAGKG